GGAVATTWPEASTNSTVRWNGDEGVDLRFSAAAANDAPAVSATKLGTEISTAKPESARATYALVESRLPLKSHPAATSLRDARLSGSSPSSRCATGNSEAESRSW